MNGPRNDLLSAFFASARFVTGRFVRLWRRAQHLAQNVIAPFVVGLFFHTVASMPLGMRRGDLQSLARSKIDDALLLLQNSRWTNAYYLGGYAVEIGIKACIARQISAETIPDLKFVNATYKHGLRELITTAGLAAELQQREDSDAAFSANWGVVSKWNPESRYQTTDSMTAQLFISAIINTDHGVLPWIKTHW